MNQWKLETDKENISNSEDQHVTSNPNKEKNKEPLQIEQLDYNDLDAQTSASKTYPIFIARDQFPGSENNFEIRKRIRDAFSNHFNDIINIRWEKHQYLIVFIIEFCREETYLKYANKRHLLLNATIFPYDSANIEAYIQRGVKQQAKNSVKLTDVLIFYETEALLKNIINITGKQIKNFHSNEQKLIQNYEFEMRRYKQNNYGRRNTRYAPKQPQYKTVYIEFINEAGAKYLLEKGWSLNIEDFNIKILPSNNNHELYKGRTSHGYKITGLSNNTNVKDMTKIVSLINGKTCSIPKARTRYCCKTAYVMVEENDFKDKIMKLLAFNTTLFIIPLSNDTKTCAQCGSPEHMIPNCDAEHTSSHNGQKFFKPVLIARNNVKIVVNKSISDNYGTIMKINEDFNKIQTQRHNNARNNNNRNRTPNNQQQQQQQQRWIQNQRVNSTHIRDNQHQTNITKDLPASSSIGAIDATISSDLAALKDQMKWAEKNIKELEDKVKTQQNEIEKFNFFIQETSQHNLHIKEAMNKMFTLQQQMAQKEAIKDSQLNEILTAVKGNNANNYQNQDTQEEELRLQFIPQQNLNPQQLPSTPHRRNSREGRTTPTNINNFSTPSNSYRKETYIPSIYDNNNDSYNEDDHNNEN